MEQIYRPRVDAHHRSDLLVQPAIREAGHCEFTANEVATGFTDLVAWAHTGVQAEGDDILNPEVVADPAFGCRFTDPTFAHVWRDDPCPGVQAP